MTAKDIRKRMIDLDVTGVDIASALGCTRQHVSLVITGRICTPWLRRAIAARLGMTYLGMWGEPDPGTARGVRHLPPVTASLDTSNQGAGSAA